MSPITKTGQTAFSVVEHLTDSDGQVWFGSVQRPFQANCKPNRWFGSGLDYIISVQFWFGFRSEPESEMLLIDSLIGLAVGTANFKCTPTNRVTVIKHVKDTQEEKGGACDSSSNIALLKC